ncbi:MAG: hypothetical protein MJZ31_05480 [Bacteroidales bacterium]|nr:hypothetical protein [Bacteroidales bacterium]
MKEVVAILMFLSFIPTVINAQSRRERKAPVYSYQEGYEYSFNRELDNNKGVPMANLYRDDMLYHSESAYITPKDRANISLLKYSRLGLGKDWELSTNIAEDVFRPMVGAKYQWAQWGKMNKVNIISSSMSLSTFYPGLRIAKNLEMEDIVVPQEPLNRVNVVSTSIKPSPFDPDMWIVQKVNVKETTVPRTKIAKVFEIGHELLYTRVWSSDPNCSTGNPYAALTIGLATYWGANMAEAGMAQMQRHVLAQRSPTYTRSGFRMHLKCWADGYITSWLTLHGGLFGQLGVGLHKPVSLEGRFEAEMFLTPRLSVTLGGIGSLGRFEGIKNLAMGYPMFDLSFYFGKKRSMSGLFDLKL